MHIINSRRKKEIIEYLSDTDYRTLKDITDKLAISMNTTQGDINKLAEENLVKKFYGGVSPTRKKDSTFQSRIVSHIEEKQRIAKYATALADDNDLLYIDSGFTAPLLTDYLHRNFHLAVATNNIYVITEVIEVVNQDLTIVGLRLKHSSCSPIDVCDWDYLNSLNVNKTFLATTGLTIQGGAINPDNAETITKTSMTERSQENLPLTDSSKFDRTSLRAFANIEDFDKIITSESILKYFVEYYAAGGTQLIIA